MLQVRDSNGRIWEFFTEGPIGIDVAHLRVHEETAEGVEVVYLEKDGSLVALEVNDIPHESAEITPTAEPAEMGFADAIIGDPGYLIGDGKVSSSPEIGSVYACSQEFRGGGAQHTRDWVAGDYWYLARKITVQGEVDWPNAEVSFGENNGRRVVTGNALPVGHPTGNSRSISMSRPIRSTGIPIQSWGVLSNYLCRSIPFWLPPRVAFRWEWSGSL